MPPPFAQRLLAFFQHHHHYRVGGLLHFSTAAAGESPSLKPHFMVEYLVASCGFSLEKAKEACKRLNRIKPPKQPDSVLGFMRSRGFDETQIRKLLSWNPRWLCLDVDKTMKPKFQALQDMGFSGPDVTQLILSSPYILNLSFHRSVLPKIEMWRGLLGSNDLLMKFLRKNRWLLSHSLQKKILPNLSLLRACGVSDHRISMVARNNPEFILQKPDVLKASALHVERLGVPCSSGMFLWALRSFYMVGKAGFRTKLELMKSLGWSESEFLSAFRKGPCFLSVSEKLMRTKMDFWVKEAGCVPSDLALHPVLLTLSLEKRVIPRFRVLGILKSRGLQGGNYQLCTIMTLSEKNFMDNFLLCHKKEVPELLQVYTAACKRGGAL